MRAASAAVIGLLGLGCPLVLVAIVDPFLVKREEPRRRIFALSKDPVTTPLRKYFWFFLGLAVATSFAYFQTSRVDCLTPAIVDSHLRLASTSQG
jgi:hypothetical protein